MGTDFHTFLHTDQVITVNSGAFLGYAKDGDEPPYGTTIHGVPMVVTRMLCLATLQMGSKLLRDRCELRPRYGCRPLVPYEDRQRKEPQTKTRCML